MSERDNDTGQFTPAEPLTGQAGLEADLGFKPMPEDEAPPEPESDIRAEVEKLQASRVPEDDPIVPLEYKRISDGSPVPLNETISLDKATKDASDYHSAQFEEARRTDDADLTRYVDGMRAEVLADNPEIAKDLGLSKEEVAAAEAAKAEEATEAKPAKSEKNANPAVDAADDPYADIPGLDEPTKQAMRVPQIREAIEKEFSKAAETQQAYTTGLNNAQQFGQAAILALAPELAQVPLERWGEGINILAQSDPARGQQLARMFSNVAALTERQQLVAHHQQQVARQNFESFVKNEDLRTEQLAKAEGIAVDNSKIVSYWESQGVSRNQFVQFCLKNPAAASAEGRLMVLKAQRYDEMMRTPKPRGTKELPPVTRPGTSVHRSSGDNSSQIQRLQNKVASSTGHAAIRAAAELQRVSRKA